MKVSFWCCSFTKVSYSYSIFAIYSIIITSSWCLWKLRTQRRWNCANIHLFTSIMNRHLLSFTTIIYIAITLIHELIKCESSPHQCSWWRIIILEWLTRIAKKTKHLTSFSVLSKDEILWIQGSCTPNMCTFFPVVGHVEGNSPLTLRFIQDSIHGVELGHAFVHFDNRFLRQLLIKCYNWVCLRHYYYMILLEDPD